MEIPFELSREMTPGVRAFVDSLFQTIERLQKRNEEAMERIADLEQRLKRSERFRRDNPKDEDKPKSSLGSGTQDERGETENVNGAAGAKSQRKRGGQPGHQKHTRELLPSTECTEVIPLLPTSCRRCGESLAGRDVEPLRHQVWDLPEIKPIVTEYQQHRLTCSCCGVTTCAPLPEGVPVGQSGPRLIALVTLLMVCFRQSKRRVSLFCETLLNVPLSPGTIVKLQNIATAATRPAYDKLLAKLPTQDAVNADETPTKEANGKAWIWVVVAATFTVFAVRLTKAACVIRELLTEDFEGLVTSDRAKMYLWCQRLQWCWAHLKRDFESMSERRGPAGEIGSRLVELTNELFHHWHRARDGDVTWTTFKTHRNRLHGRIYLALEEGTFCAESAAAATCRNILEGYDNLWRFSETSPGREPTNNAAERALRHPVIWKQLSFGTQSAAGSRFVETLLTVLETCRQRRKNAFTFLVDSIQAHFERLKPPSILARL
jgi:transposase